jgi:uncharacterized membrane protein YeaQ/YmgE (transglycosylase-associated protein family)
MPAGLIFTIVLLIVVAVAIGLTFSLLGVLVTLAIAGLVGLVADQVVPGKLPYGWVGATAAGLLGSWLGSTLFGHFGPTVARIPIIPALLGAIIVAFLAEFLIKRGVVRRR